MCQTPKTKLNAKKEENISSDDITVDVEASDALVVVTPSNWCMPNEAIFVHRWKRDKSAYIHIHTNTYTRTSTHRSNRIYSIINICMHIEWHWIWCENARQPVHISLSLFLLIYAPDVLIVCACLQFSVFSANVTINGHSMHDFIFQKIFLSFVKYISFIRC